MDGRKRFDQECIQTTNILVVAMHQIVVHPEVQDAWRTLQDRVMMHKKSRQTLDGEKSHLVRITTSIPRVKCDVPSKHKQPVNLKIIRRTLKVRKTIKLNVNITGTKY